MSEVFTNRSWQDRGKDAAGDAENQQPPRIQIDVPMGTSYYDIQESIFRQAWQLAGTQLRAAIALGITPDTVSRVLRRYERRKAACPQVPEAWPMGTPPEPPPEMNREIEPSGHRPIDDETDPSAAPTSSEDGPEEGSPASDTNNDTEQTDL